MSKINLRIREIKCSTGTDRLASIRIKRRAVQHIQTQVASQALKSECFQYSTKTLLIPESSLNISLLCYVYLPKQLSVH
jgi:hypothetical protein